MNAQPPLASTVGPATLHLIAPPAHMFRHRVMSRLFHNVRSRGFAARNPPVFSRPKAVGQQCAFSVPLASTTA